MFGQPARLGSSSRALTFVASSWKENGLPIG
jgi:hypothetical protein